MNGFVKKWKNAIKRNIDLTASSLFYIALLLSIILSLVGCVKKVYLPHDAAYYKALLDDCREAHLECEDLLEECEDVSRRLTNCP